MHFYCFFITHKQRVLEKKQDTGYIEDKKTEKMIKTSEMTPEMLKELAFTQEEIDELNRSREMPITFDEDCPETTPERAVRFYRVNSSNKTVRVERTMQNDHIMEPDAKLSVYAHLAQVENDLKHGRVQHMDDAINEILS